MEKKAVAAAPSHTAAAAAAAPACDDEPDGCIGCILPSILGDSGPAEKMLGHPPWTRPQQGVDVGLRVNNSLVGPEGRAAKSDELVPFIPAVGKQVKWYTCGPTVYVFITVEEKKNLGFVLYFIQYDKYCDPSPSPLFGTAFVLTTACSRAPSSNPFSGPHSNTPTRLQL